MRDRLAVVVTGQREPGVYRWRSSAHHGALARELSGAGWALYTLDGRLVTDMARLFDACAAGLRFPSWFGRDWDALRHCLADLSWLPAKGHVLLWDRFGTLAQTDPQAWQRVYEVCLLAVAARLQDGAPPLYVLLRGSGPVQAPLL
jgi:RNAse (barnase) inhibitor barstar